MNIRLIEQKDLVRWSIMRSLLWKNLDPDDNADEVLRLQLNPRYVVWVAETQEGHVAGFLEGQTCNRADGCLSDRIFFIEGWWVEEKFRRQGVGHALMRTAEGYAKDHRCEELASDTWLGNEKSHNAHLAFGFAEVDRNITYKKKL